MKKDKYKTPQYTRDAIKAYKERNKVMQITVPAAVWDRMQAVGMDAKSIRPLILAELEKRESASGG